MACGVSSDDGDSGAHNPNATVRIQGVGLGPGLLLFNGVGMCDLLLLLPHVQGA